mmetsp:Transcript_5483/g.8492  ORF Transcript_5483/g.8492 Transcript_5483/m.8492 type:complete len:81 (-) Transcript_5483:1517-1759(-)
MLLVSENPTLCVKVKLRGSVINMISARLGALLYVHLGNLSFNMPSPKAQFENLDNGIQPFPQYGCTISACGTLCSCLPTK